MWYRGQGHLSCVVWLLVLVGGSVWRLSRSECVTSAGEIKLNVKGNRSCVCMPVWVTLSGSDVWRWRSVE